MTNSVVTAIMSDVQNWKEWMENSFNFKVLNRHKCESNESVGNTAILKVSCIETNSPHIGSQLKSV